MIKVNSAVSHSAFQSLSFRWSTRRSEERPRVYGGILRAIRNGEVVYALVQGSYTGKWSFPKGHSNEGETPMECTLREVAEETGVEQLPTPIEYLRMGYGHYYVFSLPDMHPLIPRDTNEIVDTKWVTLAEMEMMPLNVDVSRYVRSFRNK
jgi:8-oxo-dGTP pyrophosphatase MutT (NUDIX family)